MSAIGDVIMSLPFLVALRRARPEAHLTWLVEEAAAPIVIDHPGLDRVIVFRRKTWIRNIRPGKWRRAAGELRGFMKELRGREYETVVDLQGLFKSGIMTWLSGGRHRLGFDRTREGAHFFLNERLAPYDPDRHAVLRYLDVARHLGADAAETPDPALLRFPGEKVLVEGWLADVGRPLVVLNPGAGWRSKLWPVDSWRETCRLLAGDCGIVLTGGAEDREVNQGLADSLSRVTDLTGRTDLRALAEVFRLADVVVSPDTGPMHLAAAVGTPVVALFGPTAPWRTGPFGPGHTILRTGISCSPCFNRKCRAPKCMTGLTPGMVREAVWNKLAERSDLFKPRKEGKVEELWL